jgi:hypothetical protein
MRGLGVFRIGVVQLCRPARDRWVSLSSAMACRDWQLESGEVRAAACRH